MSLSKPFKRIFRENVSTSTEEKDSYLIDSRFSSDRQSIAHSYYLIEQDLKNIFSYVSPNVLNNKTFSHRIYEVFFRTCTEFENNAKMILVSNGYSKPEKDLNIKDYYKINEALRLDSYEVKLDVWDNGSQTIKPFEKWNGNSYTPLPWYADYNKVKHNRTKYFHLAHLENLIYASSGLTAILFAQYELNAFTPYMALNIFDFGADDFREISGGLFGVKPHVWDDSEKYDFDWNNLKLEENAFQNYPF